MRMKVSAIRTDLYFVFTEKLKICEIRRVKKSLSLWGCNSGVASYKTPFLMRLYWIPGFPLVSRWPSLMNKSQKNASIFIIRIFQGMLKMKTLGRGLTLPSGKLHRRGSCFKLSNIPVLNVFLSLSLSLTHTHTNREFPRMLCSLKSHFYEM